MEGRTILHYELLEKLGEGGMGAVWKAEDTQLRRTVALKFLTAAAGGDAEIQARLVREAQASAALDHPNICHVYGIHQADGETFIAMAFVDGPSLADKIKQRPLPLDEALDLAMQIAKGLQEAHEKGIVHRDIKPDNVMLTSKGEVKIMDFGLAAQANRSKITKEGTTLGTPAYMSPEQLEAGDVDRRADLWALGCVLYEMLTQRTPFEADYEQAIAYGILNEDPEPVTAQRAGLPPQIDDILDKALAKDPAERYQTAADLIVDLKRLQGRKPSKRTVHTQKESPRPKVVQTKPKWRLWAGAGMIALVGLLAFVLWPEGPTAPDPARFERRLLTNYPGIERAPSFSTGCGQVAYTQRTAGNRDGLASTIHVEAVGSGSPVALAQGNGDPVWSPDGRSVAFTRLLDRQGSQELVIIPALGGVEQVVHSYHSPSRGSGSVSWTADGGHVVFAGNPDEGGPSRLGLLSMEGGEVKWLTEPEVGFIGDAFPAVSPDGSQIAFIRREGMSSGWNIFVLPLSDVLRPAGEPRQLTFFDRRVTSPAWMPDGEALMFAGEKGSGQEGIWWVSASGGGEPKLFWRESGVEAYSGIAVCQDGHGGYQIAFAVSEPRNSDIYRYALHGPQRGEAVPIIQTTARDTNPLYSPDGKQIAYLSGRLYRDIWVADAEGGNARQLTDFNATVAGPLSWSPDGSSVAGHFRPAGAGDIYAVEVSTRRVTQITKDPADDVYGVWSHDGLWIYFVSTRDGNYMLFKKPAEGGEAVRVLPFSTPTVVESPDGQFLYHSDRVSGTFWRRKLKASSEGISLPDGEAELLIEAAIRSNPAFRIVGNRLYFNLGTDDGMASERGLLAFLDLESLKVQELMPFKGYFSTIAPDESAFLTVYGEEPNVDLVLLEEQR